MKAIFQNILAWLSGLSNLTKILSFVVVFTGATSGGLAWIQHRAIQKYVREKEAIAKDKDMKDLKATVDTLGVVIRGQFTKQDRFNDVVADNLRKVIVTQGNLKQYMIDNSPTKEDVKKIYSVFEGIESERRQKDEFINNYIFKSVRDSMNFKVKKVK